MRIADLIASGTTDIKTLAEEARCDTNFLQRVLRHLVGKGVFQEPTPDRFALNEAAQVRRQSTKYTVSFSPIGKKNLNGIIQTTIWRILDSHKLKPWRSHLWLSAKVPRDESFARFVRFLVEIYDKAEKGIVVYITKLKDIRISY